MSTPFWIAVVAFFFTVGVVFGSCGEDESIGCGLFGIFVLIIAIAVGITVKIMS